MKTFKEFIMETKELEKATFQQYLDYTETPVGHPPVWTTMDFPSNTYLDKDEFAKLNGVAHSSPSGDSFSWIYKGAVFNVSYNNRLGCYQLRSRESDKQLMRDFRLKMIQAFEKKHPGTIEKIKKAFVAIPGAKDL